MSTRPANDEKILHKSRKRLIRIGVVCIAIVVFAIWLISLPRTFARNRVKYSAPVNVFQQLQNLWPKK